jgi:hypothetical protein
MTSLSRLRLRQTFSTLTVRFPFPFSSFPSTVLHSPSLADKGRIVDASSASCSHPSPQCKRTTSRKRRSRTSSTKRSCPSSRRPDRSCISCFLCFRFHATSHAFCSFGSPLGLFLPRSRHILCFFLSSHVYPLYSYCIFDSLHPFFHL